MLKVVREREKFQDWLLTLLVHTTTFSHYCHQYSIFIRLETILNVNPTTTTTPVGSTCIPLHLFCSVFKNVPPNPRYP
jgi:hypothetical protein